MINDSDDTEAYQISSTEALKMVGKLVNLGIKKTRQETT